MNQLEERHREESEGLEITEQREKVERLIQSHASKLMSYAGARNPQKVLDQAADVASELNDARRELEKMLSQ